jgi:hypothetical protein
MAERQFLLDDAPPFVLYEGIAVIDCSAIREDVGVCC